MTTKEELVTTIKQWMLIDSEIKQFQKEIKEKRQIKKNLAEKLVEVMKNK